jgi:tyrosinase
MNEYGYDDPDDGNDGNDGNGGTDDNGGGGGNGGVQTFVRVDVWTLDETDPILVSYGDAVAAMQAQASIDPTSWAFQAAIHGSLSASPSPEWNQCRHQSWYFLPWHRMYLYYFERIVRQHVIVNGGPSDWALPYWNYDAGSGRNTLPTAFRNPTRADGSPNPLFVSNRRPGINTGAGLPAAITSPAFAMGRTAFTGTAEFGGGAASPLGQFAGQTGRLEQTPHNDVHVAINGLMGDPDTAAQDPIFWLHHANIDRLWWLWQQQHADPTDPLWSGQSFSFVDDDGTAASLPDSGVENTLAQLNYTYDQVAAPAADVAPTPTDGAAMAEWPAPWPQRETAAATAANPGEDREMVGASDGPVRLTGEEARVQVEVDEQAAQSLAARASARRGRAHLDVDDIDAESNPGTVYGVYVNLPDNPSDEDLATHHVGNISLFGVERARSPRGDEPPHAPHVSMDITDLLDQLAAAGTWTEGGRIDVAFRPIPLEAPAAEPEAAAAALADVRHPDTPITIGRVSLHYS